VKNIKLMIKFCSKLTLEFGYPYFFNFTLPTNYYTDPRKRSIADTTYFSFNVGRYEPKECSEEVWVNTRSKPITKQVVFASSLAITKRFCAFNILLEAPCGSYDEKPIQSFKDIIKNKEAIMSAIDNYIKEVR
jgi:hypothetical protein